ncbi:hypothetical protein DINM_020795 [Dirofilaria immitis]|nr:hypothetical protein [Dirofilaria immitis]
MKYVKGQSDKQRAHFIDNMEEFNSLASIDSKEMIIEESNNQDYEGVPVDVSFALKIIHLANFDSKNMDYTIVSHIPSSVRFSWLSANPINLMSANPSPDFYLTSVHAQQCIVDGKLLPSSCLRILFKLKRTGSRFIIEKYVPSCLAMFLPGLHHMYRITMKKYESLHQSLLLLLNSSKLLLMSNCVELLLLNCLTISDCIFGLNCQAELTELVLLTLVQMERGEDHHIHINYITPLDTWFRAMKIFTVLSLFESVVVLALIRATRAIEKRCFDAVNEFERENFRTKNVK